MNNQKMIEKTHEITDQLEREASIRLNKEQAYYKGYVQACEDFGRRVRGAIIQEAGADAGQYADNPTLQSAT